MTTDTTYNGWKNRQTWNVTLWISNDEPLYRATVDFMAKHPTSRAPYPRFIKSLNLHDERTPDGIKWLGSRLDYKALTDFMREFIAA